jgi:CO dehydrogenase/acetyl-CoA synthase gamma subunit (corrinoid Fe-S protein)
MSNMIEPKNAFETFKLPEKSNYGEKICFAFAGAAFSRQRRIAECPQLDPNVIARYSEGGDSSTPGSPFPS